MTRRRITFRVGTKEMKKIEEIAERQGTTVSEVIRNILSRALSDEYSPGTYRSLLSEVTMIRKDLDYIIDKDKRKEYVEARI